MKVEMWADIVCSWCGVANERMNAAMERFEHADRVVLEHRSFRLLADLPDGEGYDFTEYFTTQRGTAREQIKQMSDRIEGIAHADGIEHYYVADNTIGNTTQAHELLAFATTKGKHQEAWDLLFRANFAERAEVWSVDDLVAFAPRLGLDEDEVRAELTSRRFKAQVEADHAEALALGSNGVPFFVIDRKYGLSGTQSIDTLVEVLEKAWSERTETASAR